MIEAPTTVEVAACPTASIRLTIPRDRIAEAMGPAIGEVMAEVARQGSTPAGPLFAHHLRRPTDTFDFEVGFPVEAPIQPAGRVQAGSRPAGRAIRAVHQGPYEGLAKSWGEFAAWAEAHQVPWPGDFWEVYEVGHGSNLDPLDWRTNLEIPLLDPA